MSERKVWLGSAPTNCDICHIAITTVFVDGKTHMGPWANMCPGCHRAHGCGLGLGKGQKYKKQVFQIDGTWVKTAG